MKLTALNSVHHGLAAKMINAAGWDVPAFYSTTVEEHDAVRNRVGLTDFSSMGEIDVKGPEATALVEKLCVNHIGKAPVGRVVYTTMLDDNGLVLDDVTVYKLAAEHYWIVTSTGGHDRSFRWASEKAAGMQVYLTDVSPAVTLICVQGPKSRDLLRKLGTDVDLDKLKYFWAVEGKLADVPCLVSRTGFTGDLGYEVYHPSHLAVQLWNSLMEAGKEFGIAPVGIATCSGTLRLEKGYMAGAELGGASPLELPISWTVRLDKDFIGKPAVMKLKEQGLSRKLVGFEVEGGFPKPGTEIKKDGVVVGKVSSANYGPTVQKNVALGFVPPKLAKDGELFTVSMDGKDLTMKIVPIPFYDAKGERLRA